MACPAGFGSPEKRTAGPFEKPPIYPAIAEPDELKKYVSEIIYVTGGQFAILCQFAHPGLAEGSYKQSNFANRIMNRLKTTSRFLNAAVIGTQTEKEAIFYAIHSAHADVKGESYYADDPELHKWTAATLFVSLVVVHETFFGKLSIETQERLFREAAIYGTSLRMPPEMWPETLDDFWVYWNHNIQNLHVTDWARSLCRDLLWPKNMPLLLLPSLPIARVLTMHWLPERLQREYDLKITPFNTAFFHTFVAGTALVYPLIPKAIKQIPTKWYIKDMKKAVRRIEETGTWYDRKGRT